MKNINPLFHEDENPIDILYRVQCILWFLEEVHHHPIDQLEFSEEGKDGLRQILIFSKDSIQQASDALTKNLIGQKENPEKG